MKTKFIPVVLLASLIGACGGFSEDPGEPTVLATVEGEITNPNSQPAPDSLRVALIWSGAEYKVAQELEVVPEFPARFSLQINQPPPEDGMLNVQESNLPPGMQVAVGTVVGYVDRNQNGRLDMIEIGAESYVDQLVATNAEVLIVYTEATDTALAQFEQETGLRLVRGFGFARADENGNMTRFVPLNEDYELVLDPDPMLNERMCRSNASTARGGGDKMGAPADLPPQEGRPATYPSPTDPSLTCRPGGISYVATVCEIQSAGPCRGSSSICHTDSWLRPDPIPADWPCQGQ